MTEQAARELAEWYVADLNRNTEINWEESGGEWYVDQIIEKKDRFCCIIGLGVVDLFPLHIINIDKSTGEVTRFHWKPKSE